ncbi:MAG: cytochrome c [Ferruginibacter sp.]
MKRFTSITFITVAVVVVALSSCHGKREPGRVYMPDMAYSRAVETYALLDSTVFTADTNVRGKEIFYNRKPVTGTIAIGDIAEYTLPNDTLGYAMSAQVKNPLPALNSHDSAEAGRLFNINCAICHGAEGGGNGPIAGKIGAVANLKLDKYIQMADGTMYHSIYYGINNMGSYASQLSRKQRWMLVHYIRSLQPKPEAATAAAAPAATATTDSTTAKKGK